MRALPLCLKTLEKSNSSYGMQLAIGRLLVKNSTYEKNNPDHNVHWRHQFES